MKHTSNRFKLAKNHATAYTSKQTGFSLIEVLVAVLVLSVGLLGIAGLQGVSLLNTHGSYLRTQAINFDYEMMDRIRANRTLILANGSVPAELLASWEAEVAQLLPAGDVDVTLGANNTATVTVTWVDELGADPGADPDADQRLISFSSTGRI